MWYELIAKTNWILSSADWPNFRPIELTGEMIVICLLLCFIAMSSLELRFPKIRYTSWQTRHSYHTNISLLVFNSIVITIFSISALLMIADRYSNNGLLSHLPSPLLKALLSLLAVDLMLYIWHIACHRMTFLWLFHRVHHSDTYLNVSTAFRLHFVEIFATNCLKALLIIVLGIDKMLVLSMETLIVLCTIFHHTNSSFKYEEIMVNVMIVPLLHRVHHSTERNEYDSNYGTVFSFWDRLFGTLLLTQPEKTGIKDSAPNDIFGLIKFGFGWEIPISDKPMNIESMIAEAAFYKAEKRNFCPGYELHDWLEAKTDILKDNVTQRKNNGTRL